MFRKIGNWFASLFKKKNEPVRVIENVLPLKPETQAPVIGHAENPAYKEAKKYEGKKETDSKFVAFLIKFWPKTGLNYKQLAGSSFAWCALFIVAMNSEVGQKYIGSAAAIEQRKTGIEIDWKKNGIPKGAIVGLNHKGECSSGSNNHVGFADSDCAAKDLIENGKLKSVNIPIYGGNQADQVKTSNYSIKEVCAVRWPSEIPKPGPVAKSINCAGVKSNESTR